MWRAWERRGMCRRFWWGVPKERDHWEDQGIGWRMGSEWILGRLAGSMDWIRLAQDRDRRRTVVNAVMNLRVLVPRSWLVCTNCKVAVVLNYVPRREDV
jgi:hypothetical protein